MARGDERVGPYLCHLMRTDNKAISRLWEILSQHESPRCNICGVSLMPVGYRYGSATSPQLISQGDVHGAKKRTQRVNESGKQEYQCIRRRHNL
jgi:hypothetical protein